MEWLVDLENSTRSAAANLGWPLEAMLRLIIAAMAGGLVGLEREFRGRQAGFRTYLLVCLGSALVVLVSQHFASIDWRRPGNEGVEIQVDPARIAYGVMTGIGFLGAGTIIHQKGSVRGLTTAAGIWCVAGIGLACGVGMYLIGIFATLLVVLALWLLDYFEEFLPKMRYRTVTVRRSWLPGCIAETVRHFKTGGFHVVDASFERTGPNLRDVDIDIRIAFVNSEAYYTFERKLEGDATYQLLATREL